MTDEEKDMKPVSPEGNAPQAQKPKDETKPVSPDDESPQKGNPDDDSPQNENPEDETPKKKKRHRWLRITLKVLMCIVIFILLIPVLL